MAIGRIVLWSEGRYCVVKRKTCAEQLKVDGLLSNRETAALDLAEKRLIIGFKAPIDGVVLI